MELNMILSIIDKNKEQSLIDIHRRLGLSVVLVQFGKGTATSEHLSLYDLKPQEKAIIATVASEQASKNLFYETSKELYIDIPGNGIMMSIPLKSVGGGNTLAYLTDGQTIGGGMPCMNFEYELIVVILNEGHSDSVMDVARKAGAEGGTVLHAKGTGKGGTEKFYGVSLADEKDLIYILSLSSKKSEIMRAIGTQCGSETPIGAICFSLPVSEVSGIRRLNKE